MPFFDILLTYHIICAKMRDMKGKNQQILDRIRTHLDTYAKTTMINVLLSNVEGKIEMRSSDYPSANFCDGMCKMGEECTSCREKAGKLSNQLGEAYVFFCPAGFVQWCSPVILDGEYSGAYFSQPVLPEPMDDVALDEATTAVSENVRRTDLVRELSAFPIVYSERMRYLADMLYILSRELMADEFARQIEKRAFYREQAILNEEIQRLKSKLSDNTFPNYAMNLEETLVQKVRHGDKTGANKILNELLGAILFESGNDIEIIKIKVLELTVLISRAVINTANVDDLYGLNFSYLRDVLKITSVDRLCVWITNVLNTFMGLLASENNTDNYVINEAKQFIRKNSASELTLSQVANFVYLSPSYFSRIFKKETGYNFIDYLNIVRVEESMKYLADLKYTLSDIAYQAGFTDQSYYSKVFKKIKGMSPGMYRKTLLK